MTCDFKLIYESGGEEHILTAPSNDGALTLTVTDDGERRRVSAAARAKVTLRAYSETAHDFFTKTTPPIPDPKGDLYFINGYQSWTETREFYGDARERDVTRLPGVLVRNFSFDRYGDATFYEYDKRILHGYDVFYVKGGSNGFAASLNAKNAYLIIEVVRRDGAVSFLSDIGGVTLEDGDEFTVCDYFYAGNFEDGLRLFRKYFPYREPEKIFGYTSWYNYYQDISEPIILRDLDALDSRFNLFQIDDGYETFVGDWLDVDGKKFPRGLSPIVEAIKKKGFTAGIWLAPFVAEEKSRLFRERRDWFRKGPDGAPVRCGSNWSGFYALDLDNGEAMDYVGKCLSHYADMGFDFFKLDFLYGASLPAYEGETRSAVAERAYSFLRGALPGKTILGCGATLSNAAGKFDYVRVGPDVSLIFDDVWYMKFMHRERISTKVTLQNTVYRSFMNGCFFGCDPDVFLLRDDNIKLTAEQRRALITLNALFGSMMMTSDNIAEYDDGKKAALDSALDLFRHARVTDYSRRDTVITVVYELFGDVRTLRYDTERGILI
ncbi:MAG: alpha-galactosidase [Clostridia bacterium]|nr:alpha-galactosidase [Clostridia bacterium]